MAPADFTDSEKEKLLKGAFERIKKEMNDHLEAINQNTVEIENNFEFLEKLEAKIDKLNEKIEELAMAVNAKNSCNETEREKIRLSGREQEIFLLLYTSEEFLNYADIAKRLGLTEVLVGNYINSMVERGIPLLKRYANRQPSVMLEPEFRVLQAKQNVVEIDRRIALSKPE